MNLVSRSFSVLDRGRALGCMVRGLAVLLLGVGSAAVHAQAQAPTALPAGVELAIQNAKLPKEAFSLLVQEVPVGSSPAPVRLSHRAQVPVNPASVMKLVTTYAALDLLGPAYTWATPVYLDGPVRDGTLRGNLILKGQGDPKLVVERLWLLLRRVQGLGITAIQGDILLDRSAFELPETDPASFDGEPFRPYNAAPDALLLNFKSVALSLVPDRSLGLASVSVEPPLAGVLAPLSVPLQPGECGDYRAALKADFSDPSRIQLAGAFPASCGEKVWHVAYADPKSYAPRLIESLWTGLGGKLSGRVKEGKVPTGLQPVLEQVSPSLTDVVRDINKFSNNVMAQQLFLTLGLPPVTSAGRVGSDSRPGVGFEAARERLRGWWKARWPDAEAPVIENGSGLSRNERISAQALGGMLQSAYLSPVMPELMASLPVAGVDGTLRRARPRTGAGAAHLKTGSLRDVSAIAGYVLANGGKRYIVVAIANHPTQAQAARPVFDALLDWVQKEL